MSRMAEHAMEHPVVYDPVYVRFQETPKMEIIPKGAIAKALAAAQLEMSNPSFDTSNPFFKNRYASLAAVRNAVVPVLAKHGIGVTQNLETTDRGIACTTTLWHESGEFLAFGPLVMPASKQDAQGFGSASTYARRYALMSVCGVVGDDDDDANAATGKPSNGQGIGVHNPLGDVKTTPEAMQYAQAFHACLSEPSKVYHTHLDLTDEGEEVYRATWALLDSKTRSAIKKAIDTMKAAA